MAAPTRPWTITQGKENVALFEMPDDPHRVYALSRVYYDAVNRRFMLDILTGPASSVYTDNHHSVLILDPNTKQSRWVAASADLLSSDMVFPLPPAGTTMFMNSGLARQVGGQVIEQPYGTAQSVMRISEQKYSKTTMLKSYTKPGAFLSKNFGNGAMTWQVRDYDKKIIMSLSETYTDNSHDYAGFWTPDGLYFFMILPDNVYMTLGPFRTGIMDMVLDFNLKQERDFIEDEIKLDHRTLSGELTTQEHYGLPFDNMMGRVAGCTELYEYTGPIKSLTLHPPGSLQNFGYPGPVGKRMVFDYVAEKSSGVLKANLITYVREQDAFGKYKEWLETLTVINGDKTLYVSCP